jgi:hypothetical protein
MLGRFFGIDPRALVAFRIALGFLLLCDLWIRFPYIAAHYTDLGSMPRSALITYQLSSQAWSLHLISGHVLFQYVLFLIAGVFAGFLIVGYKVKLSLFVSWVLLFSLQNRNPTLLQGGDILFRLLLFWSLFLPFDSLQKTKPIVSLGTFALLMQVVGLYVMTGFLKNHAIWLNGEAVYYALNLDLFSKAPAKVLLNYPEVLKHLTLATLYLERYGPLLLIAPFAFIRMFGVVSFVGMHIGFLAFMHLGLFPYVNLVSLILFIPPKYWDHVQHFFQCFFVGLTHTIKSNWPELKIVQSLFIVVCIYACVMWNLESLPTVKEKMPPAIRGFSVALGLNQHWGMFAPYPLKSDGWYVVDGFLRSGKRVDPYFQREHHPRYEKPLDIATQYPSQTWRRYFLNYRESKFSKQRLYYGQYLCREWNRGKSFEDQLLKFSIIFFEKITPPPGKPFSKAQKHILWNHKCFD